MDERQEEMKTQVTSLASQINAKQEEMKSIVNDFKEKMEASIAEMKDEQKETMACQEMTEAFVDSKEPNPEEMQSRAEHRGVPRSMLE
jgi:hypothetical protein